jgi:hypothetical protein
MSLEEASKADAEIFQIIGTSENGKQTMRCSRCEGLEDKKRGKGYALLCAATTKAKEHLDVYCPELNPKADNFDANLRHTLLVNLPKGVLSTISKVGLALRKFDCICMILSPFSFSYDNSYMHLFCRYL